MFRDRLKRSRNKGKSLEERYVLYPYMFSPRQLRVFMECLDETAKVEGAVLEIGCAYGATTAFLYRYLMEAEIHREYICIDTFAGFTNEDISYEKNYRNKQYSYTDSFPNDVALFKRTLAEQGIRDIRVIKEDIANVDIASLPRLSFCLLDVDLYKPVKAGLAKIYPLLNPGGICIVDDCWAEKKHPAHPRLPDKFDGALDAYREFLAEHQMEEIIVEHKLGVIKKQKND
jgi:predicted O-methyltransferase YrrM